MALVSQATSLSIVVPAVLPTPPASPDSFICDDVYGTNLNILDCLGAAGQFPTSTNPQIYTVRQRFENLFGSVYSLPMSLQSGNCYISVEVAGDTGVLSLSLMPYTLRAMAAWVIQQCVDRWRGRGGFITQGLARTLSYFGNPLVDSTDRLPPAATFLTLSITGLEQRLKKPGDTDPSVPLLFAHYNRLQRDQYPQNSEYWALYNLFCVNWNTITMGMTRGGTVAWWDQVPDYTQSDTMTYECDMKLGNPPPTDCLNVEYGKLGKRSDSIEVDPDNVTFLSSGTCYLAISSTSQLTLTWQQIQTALDTLMNFCVQNPSIPSQGGRAYYGPQPRSSRRKKRRQNDVTGLNALPANANLTIFRQTQPWTSMADELKSCMWEAITKGLSMSLSCNTEATMLHP